MTRYYTEASVNELLAAVDEVNGAVAGARVEVVTVDEGGGGSGGGGGGGERVCYLGSSDLSDLGGTKPTGRRMYYGLEGDGFPPEKAKQKATEDAKAGRATFISIGPGNKAGEANPNMAHLDDFYPALRANPKTIFIPWHEPEDDETSPATWASFNKKLINAVRDNVDGIETSFCLMAYSLRDGGSGQGFMDALDRSLFDYVGFDSYNNAPTGTPDKPGTYHNLCLDVAREWGKPLLILETGQDNRQGDPAKFWDNTVAWTQKHPEVYAHLWWPQVGPERGPHRDRQVAGGVQACAGCGAVQQRHRGARLSRDTRIAYYAPLSLTGSSTP